MVGVRDLAAYSAAKGGVIALGRLVAVDYGRDGIRVNILNPGTVRTPLVDRSLLSSADPRDPEAALRAATRHYPMGRLGEAADVANAVVFLASDESSWITGAVIPVDGGYTSR